MPTPARVTTKKLKPKAEPESDLEILSRDEDAETYEARLFDSATFTFSTDVNSWLLVSAGSGRAKDLISLVDSLIVVTPKDGENLEDARERVRDSFHDLLGSQPHFPVERLMRLVGDMTEAAGNETTDSSND